MHERAHSSASTHQPFREMAPDEFPPHLSAKHAEKATLVGHSKSECMRLAQ